MHAILYLVFKILLSAQTAILALAAAAADASRHPAAFTHFQILNNRVHTNTPFMHDKAGAVYKTYGEIKFWIKLIRLENVSGAKYHNATRIMIIMMINLRVPELLLRSAGGA
jgi:hypothetical protein